MQQTRCMNCMKEIPSDARYCQYCGYDQRAEQPTSILRPKTILRGRYVVGHVIGRGGFGITYVGFDLTLEMKVAIKEYYPSGTASRNNSWSNQVVWESGTRDQDARAQRADSMERVLKEARRTARLANVPSVVRVTDAFCENETAYLVMDFIEGITLKEYLARHGVMTWEECKQLLFPVMEGLAEAHDMGIIHRDISPDNIMIGPDGTAKLLDLGAAVDISLNEGQASTLVVKNHFSAVEQYDETGKIGSWTDVYAFAAMLYYCLTGKLMMPVMDRLMTQGELVFPPQPEIPEHVKNALRKALKINHADRISDMRTFARALTEGEEGAEKQPENGKATEGMQSTTGETSKRKGKKLPILLAGLLCAVVVIGIVVFAVQSSGKMGEETAVSNSADNGEVEAASGEETESMKDSETADGTEASDGVEGSEEATEESGTTDAENGDETIADGSDGTEDEKNVLMSDKVKSLTDTVYYVFESGWPRDIITAITFLDTLTDEPEDSWDVSENGDGAVKAWVKEEEDGFHLYLAAEGGIFAPPDSSYLFYCYENCTYIEWNGVFDTSDVVNMRFMFRYCYSLRELDLAGFDTSNVKDMFGVFDNCNNLTELDVSGFDTSKVTNMRSMFGGCNNLMELDVSEFDTSQVTDMHSMFYSCNNLTELDVSGFDTSKVTDMGWMFMYCNNLTELDVSEFDTSNVTDMSNMFYGCNNLTELDVSGFDTSKVTDMSYMFDGCNNLTELDVSGFDTSKVTDMRSMFYDCNNLTELDVSGFDTSKVTDMSYMFSMCTSLTSLTLWSDCSDSLRKELYEQTRSSALAG